MTNAVDFVQESLQIRRLDGHWQAIWVAANTSQISYILDNFNFGA